MEKPEKEAYDLDDRKIAIILETDSQIRTSKNSQNKTIFISLIIVFSLIYFLLDSVLFHSKDIGTGVFNFIFYLFFASLPIGILSGIIKNSAFASNQLYNETEIFLRSKNTTRDWYNTASSNYNKFKDDSKQYEEQIAKIRFHKLVETTEIKCYELVNQMDSLIENSKFKRDKTFLQETYNSYHKANLEFGKLIDKNINLFHNSRLKAFRYKTAFYKEKEDWILTKLLKENPTSKPTATNNHSDEQSNSSLIQGIIKSEIEKAKLNPEQTSFLQRAIKTTPDETIVSKVESNFSTTKEENEINRIDTPRKIDYNKLSITNAELGQLGEEFAVKYEIDRLKKMGKNSLAEKVYHISKEEGDGLGYDIVSYNSKNEQIFIEVKTTTDGPLTQFFLSDKEHYVLGTKYNYIIYRVYEFDTNALSGKIYKIDTKEKFYQYFDIRPTGYAITPRPKKDQ